MNNAPVNKIHGSSRSTGKPSTSNLRPNWVVIVLVATGLGVLGTLWVGIAKGKPEAPDSSPSSAGSTSQQVSSVFTTARPSFVYGLREFFNLQSTPVQPIAFNHQIHIQNGLQCVGCHAGVTQGPDAGIAGVNFCMACHQAIATDNPEIKKLAAYAGNGQEVPWQPVFWFYPEVHVLFQHAPHFRAAIGCEECHGDLSKRTVAVRTKDLSMKFCLNCHKAKGVDLDCITCHY
jgi:Cytochrome c7 and related cytochrome c